MRTGSFATVLFALVAFGCSSEKSSKQEGLPPATDWQASAAAPGAANPHAANPHAMGADPHAGLGMGGMGADPHAGLDMGGSSVDHLGLPPPDPNRPIDPNKYLRGIIQATDATRAAIKPGAVLFLSVKRAGDDGKPTGAPIAVDRLVVSSLPMAFELTGAHAMIGGTGFDGKVVVSARVDQDSDAISKQPGDVEGHLVADIPADTLILSLDTILQ